MRPVLRSPSFLCVTLAALAVPVAAQAAGVSVTIEGFPENNVRPRTQLCPGVVWNENCEWNETFTATIAAPDGIRSIEAMVGSTPKVPSCTPALPETECDSAPILTSCTFSETIAVECGDTNGSDVKVIVIAKDCDASGADAGIDGTAVRPYCYNC